MSRILITSGPTRQYLDPVRYLTNASSGRMGAALAAAALDAGHQAVVVSGPVDVQYPPGAEVVPVVSTEEMLAACQKVFPTCDGVIAAAAPCDYRPLKVARQKLRKTGGPLRLELAETPDVVAALAAEKGPRWIVAFALETQRKKGTVPICAKHPSGRSGKWGLSPFSADARLRAMQKLERKGCDLIVLNGPESIHAPETRVEVLGRDGQVLGSFSGSKAVVASEILGLIRRHVKGTEEVVEE